VLVENPPDVAGLVTNTETVTTQVEHKRPEGMPEIYYSEDEMFMAMLLYAGVGDSYTDNGDGTYTYCYCTPDGVTYDTVTDQKTISNWYSGTEADVFARLEELKDMYPEGTSWDEDSYYDNPGSTLDAYFGNNNACAGFAKLVSDYCFGYDAPVRQCVKSQDELKVGDIIYTPQHASVYLGTAVTQGAVETPAVVDGNNNDVVVWGGAGVVSPDGKFSVLTRWPE